MFLTIGGLKRLSAYIGGQLKSAVSFTGGTLTGVTLTTVTLNNSTINTVTLANSTIGTSCINSGLSKSTADLTRVSTTVLAPVAGLTVPLSASSSYRIFARLPVKSTSGGAAVALGTTGNPSTLTLTSENISVKFGLATGFNLISNLTTTTLATAVGETATVTLIEIDGVVNTNAAGDLAILGTQNVSNAATTTFSTNGFLSVSKMA